MAQIDIDKLEELVADSDKILLKPEAEDTLVKLLQIRDQVEAAIKEAELKLEEEALKINPNFRSIRADKVKVFYRFYGAKYKIDESLIKYIPKELYTIKTSFLAVADEIEKIAEENDGKLPQGIIEIERTKTMKFSLKNKETEE